MDGNRELEQLDAEARALKATLMRYMSEAMLEDQGLGKLSADLTKLVQASQRQAAESAARSEQKVQALATTVEALRSEVRTLLAQSHDQLVREVRAAVSEQLAKKAKKADAEDVAERLERLQSEVRALGRSLQPRSGGAAARPVAVDVHGDAPRNSRRATAMRAPLSLLASWRVAAPSAVLLAVSVVGYNAWWTKRPAQAPAEVALPAAPPVAKVTVPTAAADPPPVQAASVPVQTAAAPPSAVAPPVKQAAWDSIWKSALDLPVQQCWFEGKSNAKPAKFRDCACPKAEKESACEWSGKWSAEASVAALQAVLSVAAAKPMTIDARAGAGTFNAIDLLVRDCGFKDAVLTQAVAELRATRGAAPAAGGEPATHQILNYLKKNLHTCR